MAEITLLRSPSKVFIYELDETGSQKLHCIIQMLQKRHLDYVEEHYKLRDDSGKVMLADSGAPMTDWNAAAGHFFLELFVGCEETVKDDAGNIINTRSPQGKETLAKLLPGDFSGWVMKCARNRKVFYGEQREVAENLASTPDGSTV
jgi:hypothetical protein